MSSKKKIAIAIILVISLIVFIAVGYTFSKYFQLIEGKASAQIAAWSFKANAGDTSKKLSEIVLKPVNGNTKIAPGTNGEFKIKVDSIGSEVDVDYKVEISQEKLPANMRFNIKGKSQTYTSMSALATAELHGTLNKSNNQEKTYDIQWNWPFETKDAQNILLDSKDMEAISMGSDLGFKINVIGEQAE